MDKQPDFKISSEVQKYWNDTESLTKEWHEKNMQGWHVTEKWVKKYQYHLSTLLPLAENGDAMAQYAVATIYLTSYLYDNEEDAINNHDKDALEMSKWLTLAAKQGVLSAIDNLITTGTNKEAKKLMALYRANITTSDKNQKEWERNMLLIYNLAYEKQS